MTIDRKPNMTKTILSRIVEEESGLEAPEAESTTIAAAKDEAERNESTEADRCFLLLLSSEVHHFASPGCS